MFPPKRTLNSQNIRCCSEHHRIYDLSSNITIRYGNKHTIQPARHRVLAPTHKKNMLSPWITCTCAASPRSWEVLNSNNSVCLLRFMNPCRVFCSVPNKIHVVSPYIVTCTYWCSGASNFTAAFTIMPTTTTIAELQMVMAFDSV